MANYTLTPSPWQTFFYANGAPVASGQLFTYLAGTTTPAPTYLNASGTPNTNPIILDAAGRAVIYLAGGSYRFDLYDSVVNGGALIKTEDNITSVPLSASQPADTGVAGATILAGQVVYLSDGSGGLTAGRWYLAQASNAYSSTNPEVGFAAANTSAGNAIAIIRIGQVVTGLSVTTGLAYYIDAFSAGAITATAPGLVRYMGQADTASSLVVGNAPPARPLWPTVATSGTINNFNVAGDTNTGSASFLFNSVIYVSMTNPTLTTITGIQAGSPGQRIVFASSIGQVDFLHQNAGSSVGNRLTNFATTGPTSLAPGVGTSEYIYDNTLGAWRLIAHQQGAYISPPFNAAVFIVGGGAWVVTPANVHRLAYRLNGRTLTVKFALDSTSLTGTPGNALSITNLAYGGFLAASVFDYEALAYLNTPGVSVTTGYASSGSAAVNIVSSLTTPFPVSTTATFVEGSLTFDVQ